MGLIVLIYCGALKVKLMIEEWMVNMHIEVYSRSNSTGKKVDCPCMHLFIWNRRVCTDLNFVEDLFTSAFISSGEFAYFKKFY